MMVLKRLQAVAVSEIPDPECAVARRRREPGRVVRENHREERIAMTLKRP
jgi:hypothetical protein